MVFSSLQFVFIFMPLFFVCYYMVPGRFRNVVLLAGSLCFYLAGTVENPGYFFLFLISIFADFLTGLWIEEFPERKKMFLLSGISFHLICLITFKYLGFILGEIENYTPRLDFTDDIILPIGISFYTFQGISYLADVYKGRQKAEKNLLRYAVYISMFEQLIAGPIVTYGQVRRDLYRRYITPADVINGTGIFIFGLGLKVLLANPLGRLWSQTCSIGFESISTPLAWMAIYAFTFQIYFDFFGYSLMAIGLGRMLGFRLPKNFDHPYVSLTMTEFWRRWHMTLGAWFREYVYIPLGGNRGGTAVTVRNLFIVWLLTGIWHGAGYNFVLWGTVLFLILISEKFLTGNFFNKIPAAGHIYMIFLIPLTWAIFAIDDMGQLGVFFSRLFPFSGQGPGAVFEHDYLKYLKIYFPFFIAGIILSSRIPYRLLKQVKKKKVIWMMLGGIFAACVFCMARGMDDPFLYFRF